ncbi:hypothetical protein [Neomegalonema sp.]|uniref:hypothetical protein n=1 Tax=Neomegalonema sp. TaxID=2039713 RepID=UPI0026138DF1|nr:hypothetical protein [Neomegalonema sp.]MDD2867079.1 hypothetical protein [Neomegalonema sp.]
MIGYDGEAILYREAAPSWWSRSVFVLMGLTLAIMIPGPVWMQVERDEIWPSIAALTPFAFLMLTIFTLLPLVVGGIFVAIGLASVTELRLDPASGAAERIRRGPVIRGRERFPLSGIGAPELALRHHDDGPGFFLRLNLAEGRPVEIEGFQDKAEAEFWRDRILKLLASAAP